MKRLKISLRDCFSGCTDVRIKTYESEYRRQSVISRTKDVKYVREFCTKSQISYLWEIVNIEKI